MSRPAASSPAPTTSLPEKFRWRQKIGTTAFCWLRDATFTLLALMNSGYTEEASAWHNWLLRARWPARRPTCRSCTASWANGACLELGGGLAARVREFAARLRIGKRRACATAVGRLW